MTSAELALSLQNILAAQQQGKLDEAYRQCTQLLEAAPSNPFAVHLLGLLECQRGYTAQGLVTLNRSLELEPNNPEFYNNLAGVLGQLQRYDDAIQNTKMAIKLKPNFGLAYFNQGASFEFLGDMRAAEEAYRQAIKFVPNHPEARYRLGCILHRLEQYEEAEEWHLSAFEPLRSPRPRGDMYDQLVNPRIVMVVTCKGRLAHLKQTLPQMLDFQDIKEYRVVAVDFSDPDGAFEWCKSLQHPRLAAIRVLDNTEIFHKSRAFNCGANVLPSDILCFVDADSILHPQFLPIATQPLYTAGNVITKREMTSRAYDTVGVCCVRTAAYRAVKGYDEEIQGYGPEDLDFFARSRQQGKLIRFAAWLYPRAISHSGKERTRYYIQKDIRDSMRTVIQRLFNRQRTINSAGYGRAAIDLNSIETNFATERRVLTESNQ